MLAFATVLIAALPTAFAITWEVQIPPNSSDVNASSHFIPSELSVRPGDVVKWENTDAVTHTITSGTLATGIDGIFDSGQMKSGQTFSHMFSEIGEYDYFCTIHPWMNGIVNVVDIPEGFKIIHNVGSDVSETTFDVLYKVKRSLTNVEVNPSRNMLVFNFVGKINDDVFFVYLPQELIKDPQSVWVDDTQITDYISNPIDGFTKLTIPLEDHSSQVTIFGTKVIGEIAPKPLVLINQISAITDKQTYHPNDVIVISGEVKNLSQLTFITYNIISPNHVTLLSKDFILMSPKFSIDVSTDVLRDYGKYTIDFDGNNINSPTLNFNYEFIDNLYPSPKKQMEYVFPGDVMCNEGLELLMKNSDGSAVCVTESTALVLMKRGWADYF